MNLKEVYEIVSEEASGSLARRTSIISRFYEGQISRFGVPFSHTIAYMEYKIFLTLKTEPQRYRLDIRLEETYPAWKVECRTSEEPLAVSGVMFFRDESQADSALKSIKSHTGVTYTKQLTYLTKEELQRCQ